MPAADISPDAPIDLRLFPRAPRRHRRPSPDRRLRCRRARRRPTARRSTSTTRASSGPAAREYRDRVRRRRRRLRGQGVPVPGDGPARRGRGSPSRRGDRRRAARRAARRVPARAHRVPRQQQVGRRAARRPRRSASGASSSTRSTSSTASRRWPAEAARAAACWCGSRRGSRRTRTSTSRPAPTTRSSASPSRTARRVKRRCGWRSPMRLRFAGFHCHIGSQILRARVVRRRGRDRRRPGGRSRRATRRPMVDELNLGGGLGVPYTADDLDAPSIAEFAARRARRVRDRAVHDAGLGPRRAHGRGGAFDRRAVGDHALPRRHGQGDPRRAHLRRGRRRHERQPASRPPTARATRRSSPRGSTEPRPCVATVAGKHCEQGDVLVRGRAPPRRRRGRRRARHPGDRRVRLLDGVELQPGAPCRGGVRRATASAGSVVRRETLDDLVARLPDVRETDAWRCSGGVAGGRDAVAESTRTDGRTGAGRLARLRQRRRRAGAPDPRPRRRDRGARRGAARGRPGRGARPHQGPRPAAPGPLLHRRRRARWWATPTSTSSSR